MNPEHGTPISSTPLGAKEVYNKSILARVLSSGNASGAYFVNGERGTGKWAYHEAMLDLLGQHLVNYIQLKCRSEVMTSERGL